MAQYQVIVSQHGEIPKSIEQFLEMLTEKELNFYADTLENVYSSSDELNSAVVKAIRVCQSMGLPLNEHFKAVYLYDNDSHSVRRDWKLSRLAYYLSIINGNPANPIVGRMQIELLGQFISHS